MQYQTFAEYDQPQIITPSTVNESSMSSLRAWCEGNEKEITEMLLKKGVILFRGFDVQSSDDFNDFLDVFGGNSMNYYAGSVPRGHVRGKVFNATELTRHFNLKLHNELAYQVDFPELILFYCNQPSLTGGETVIADVRNIYNGLPKDLVDEFDSRKIKYVRTYQNVIPLRELFKKYAFFYEHLTWNDSMQAKCREDAEKRCEELGMSYKWRENGDLEVWNTISPVSVHPVTGEKLWFNQVIMQNFNHLSYGKVGYGIRKALYRNNRDMPNNCYFGDGEEIPFSAIKEIFRVSEKNKIVFPWRANDVMLIDNRLVSHGRNAYSGPRNIQVGMLKNSPFYPSSKYEMPLSV